LTHPGEHDAAHPLARSEGLEGERGDGLEEHVRVVEDGEGPRPLLRREVAELALDVRALLEVHDGRVGDVAHVDAHDEVHERVPEEEALVELAVGALEHRGVDLGLDRGGLVHRADGGGGLV
jgi:hypothetical protein